MRFTPDSALDSSAIGALVSKPRASARPQAANARPPVKTSVVLDADTHTRLIAASALRHMDRSTYAAEILREQLKGVVCFDKAMKADLDDTDDRPDE